MNTKPEIPDYIAADNKAMRLSLDLPKSHHEMLDVISQICGLPSKNEAVRRMIELSYEYACAALEGNIPAMKHLETNTVVPILGSPFVVAARRAVENKQT